MKVEIKNGYCTGNYAIIGGCDDWIEVDELPSKDATELKAYKKRIDGGLEFDAEKYAVLCCAIQETQLATLKAEKILHSKQKLEDTLSVTKLISKAHRGVEKKYSITAAKQQYLTYEILTAQADASYKPSWNATGEESTDDWTIEELMQLAVEMKCVVQPLVRKQQKLEKSINKATTIEELEAIDISFK